MGKEKKQDAREAAPKTAWLCSYAKSVILDNFLLFQILTTASQRL